MSINSLSVLLAFGGIASIGVLPGVALDGRSSEDDACISRAAIVVTTKQRLKLMESRLREMEEGGSPDDCLRPDTE